MIKFNKTTALLISLTMCPIIPSAAAYAAAADIPAGTLLYNDTLATQSVGEVPSDWFCTSNSIHSTTPITASDAVIAADPSLPTGKYISIGTGEFSNNLFADMDTSVTTLNATGQPGDRQTLYAISWNQFIAEGQQEHTSWTKNRSSVLRFVNGSEGTYNDDYSPALGTAHFNGSKLNIMQGSEKSAESADALTRGKWYTFKAYIHANQGGTNDVVNLIAYEYGTNESTAVSTSFTGSFPINATAFRIYNYDVNAGEKRAISDISISAYNGDAAADFYTVNNAAKSVNISDITSGNITSVDALNSLEIPNGIDHVWSSNNADIISVNNDGTLSLNAPATTTKLCLTLTLVSGNASTELYVPVTVKGTNPAKADKGVILYKDTLSVQNAGDVPSDLFCVGDDMKKSATELTTGDAVIESNPMLPTGKYISIGNGNLVADMDKSSGMTLDATGQPADRQTLYAISWNQFIAEGQQEYVYWTKYRTSVLRFIDGSQGTYDDNWSPALGTAHFNGSKLNIIQADTKLAESTAAITRGKWYTFKAYIHANQDGTNDIVNLIAYEYGKNESDAINVSFKGSFPVKADAFKIYNYLVDEGQARAISDIKICAYNGAGTASFYTVNTAAKSVNISDITSGPITSVDALNSLTIPSGIDYTWSSNNNSVISVNENGSLVLNKPAGDTTLCLTLTLISDGVSTDIYVPVTVSGESSGNLTGIGNIQYTNGQLSVDVNVNETFVDTVNADEYIAVYDADNKLVGVSVNTTSESSYAVTRAINTVLPAGTYKVKLMLFDEMKPIMSAIEKSLTVSE